MQTAKNVEIRKQDTTLITDDYIRAACKEVYEYHKNGDTIGEMKALVKKEKEIKDFTETYYSPYLETMEKMEDFGDKHFTKFTYQSKITDKDIGYACGEWVCNDLGVRKRDKRGNEIEACDHPILLEKVLKNVETGREKWVVAFRTLSYKPNEWHKVIAPKEQLSDNRAIIGALSPYGVNANSKNAKYLVEYLANLVKYDNQADYNDGVEKLGKLIPTEESVSRLGWIKGNFYPYAENAVFDGDENNRQIYEAVTTAGNEELWLETVKDLTKESVYMKIVLAASFGSVLIEPLGLLNFIVHLWSTRSAIGKSVALRVALSVWGNPKEGYLFFQLIARM